MEADLKKSLVVVLERRAASTEEAREDHIASGSLA